MTDTGSSAGSLFQWPLRVYYEDTDSGGVVYYANYLRFMERARTEWLRAAGFDQQRLRDEQGLVFVVRRANLDFRAPARLDDALLVDVVVKAHGRIAIDLHQRVLRDDRLLCCGDIQIVCLDAELFRPRPIPSTIAAQLLSKTNL